MIDAEIRDQVRQRATHANSEKEMGHIIYHTLVANKLNWREVGNESVKQLLVDAIRAYRSSQETGSLRVAV